MFIPASNIIARRLDNSGQQGLRNPENCYKFRHMDRPPDSTHERLNRELARLRYRDVSLWGGWALLFGLFGLFVFLYVNYPTETRYVRGIAGASHSLPSETGITVTTRVTVEDRGVDMLLSSQLVHPAPGQELCLRAGKHRFTGHTSFVIVADQFCDGSDTTQSGE